MKYNFKGKNYEWDDSKAKANKIKHGISFKYAVQVFEDENKLVRYDYDHSYDEERWQVVGKVDDIVFVVYTENIDNIRIISARKANKTERDEYYGF